MKKKTIRHPELYCCICGVRVEDGLTSTELNRGWCFEHLKYYGKEYPEEEKLKELNEKKM